MGGASSACTRRSAPTYLGDCLTSPSRSYTLISPTISESGNSNRGDRGGIADEAASEAAVSRSLQSPAEPTAVATDLAPAAVPLGADRPQQVPADPSSSTRSSRRRRRASVEVEQEGTAPSAGSQSQAGPSRPRKRTRFRDSAAGATSSATASSSRSILQDAEASRMPRQSHSTHELPGSGAGATEAGADADAAMSMSLHVDPSSSSTALPAIDTAAAQNFGSPPLNPHITDAGNPLVSPVLGGPSSSSSHDYTSAGEGLSESIHNGGAAGAYVRSPVLVAIASGSSGPNLGRTGSLRSAASKGRAAGSRSGSFSNGSVPAGAADGHQANGSSSSHHRTSANGSATSALAGLGIAGPSAAALALGLNVDDGRFRPLYEGSTVDAREFLRLTMQSLKDLGFEWVGSDTQPQV